MGLCWVLWGNMRDRHDNWVKRNTRLPQKEKFNVWYCIRFSIHDHSGNSSKCLLQCERNHNKGGCETFQKLLLNEMIYN